MDRDLARRLSGRKPAPLAALPEREYLGDAAVLAERLANMDNIAMQEDTWPWGAQENVEVHGWSYVEQRARFVEFCLFLKGYVCMYR